MKLRCVKCEIVKDLAQEELKESGEFILNRRLRAVHFLKYLSMDMRDLCTDGRNHEWEFEGEFDKEVHQVSAHCIETEKAKSATVSDIAEYGNIIKEYETKRDNAIKKVEEYADVIMGDKNKLREIAYIDDPKLWSEKE